MSATGRFRTATIKAADGRELSEAVRVEEIKGLLLAGRHSYGEIATRYGVTRAAVAGVAHRMRKAGLLRAPSAPRGVAAGELAAGELAGGSEADGGATRRQAQLRQLVQQGKSTREIADLMGVSVPSVHSLAKRAKISLNGRGGRKGVSEALRLQVIAAVRAGETVKDVAARLLIPASTAQKIVTQARVDGLLPRLWNAAAPVSSDVRRDVIQRLAAGQPLGRVAQVHGLSRTTVETIRKHARAAGELAAPAAVPQDPAARAALVARVLDLARSGATATEIAARVGASRQWVAGTCRAAGVVVVQGGTGASAGGGLMPWTAAEREALRREAPNGIRAVMRALAPLRPDTFMPARTHSEINRQANELGIVIAAAPPQLAPDGAGVLFDDLAPDGCRWPLGLGPDGRERFCGAQRAAGATGGRARYCAVHGLQATVRASTAGTARQLAGAGW